MSTFLHLPYLQFPLFDYIKSNFMQIKEMNNLEMDAGSKYTHCFCTNRFYARLNRKKSQSHFIKHLLCYF